MRTQRLIAVTAVFAVAMSCISAVAADKIPIKKVLKAWKEQEKRFHSVGFHWKSTITIDPAFFDDSNRRGPDGELQKWPVVPAKGRKFAANGEFVMHGDKLKYDSSGELAINPAVGKFYLMPTRRRFDGEVERSETGKTKYTHPQGHARRTARQFVLALSTLRPVFLMCRPVKSVYSNPSVSELRVTDSSKKAAGRELRLIVDKADQWHIWVDPARNFLIVSATMQNRGVPTMDFEIRYATKSKAEPIPERMTFRLFNSRGILRQSYELQISKFTTKPKIGTAEFGLSFGVATMVSDMAARPPQNYIVRPNGKRRTILRSEFGKGYTYNQLRDSEPGGIGKKKQK